MGRKEDMLVELDRSRSEMNFTALESVRSSTKMLKSPVIRNLKGIVDIDECLKVFKNLRKRC
jgi:hypothetical protein